MNDKCRHPSLATWSGGPIMVFLSLVPLVSVLLFPSHPSSNLPFYPSTHRGYLPFFSCNILVALHQACCAGLLISHIGIVANNVELPSSWTSLYRVSEVTNEVEQWSSRGCDGNADWALLWKGRPYVCFCVGTLIPIQPTTALTCPSQAWLVLSCSIYRRRTSKSKL